MRNSERLAALNNVIDNSKRIIIQHTTELGGVVNQINQWPEVRQALAVLVGYTEEDRQIPGLIPSNQHKKYIQELIDRYPASTDNFPRELFANLQTQVDGLCEALPIILHTLEQMSPKPSSSTFSAQFHGILSLDEFEATVSDVAKIADILKIKNEINSVWTDYGSTIFGLELGSDLALAIFHAAISGAEQIRDTIASLTPETIKNCFRLLSSINQTLHGEPLPNSIVNDETLSEARAHFANGEVSLALPEGITNEQINGLKIAISKLTEVSHRGWDLSCSTPSVEGSQVSQSIFIIGDNNIINALPPASNESENNGSS